MRTNSNSTRRATAFAVMAVLAALAAGCGRDSNGSKVNYEQVAVISGSIESSVRTVGTIEPQNRLEVKPPIAGRIEEMLVAEGDRVKAGQIVAWLSSTERASLLDAARAKGEQELAYWREVYKPTPLIAPLDGEVIVAELKPGQAVQGSTAIVVLSDRLIVRTRVDETDIGRVRTGQVVRIRLDAYPEVSARGKVDRIAFESDVVNNVTVYEVEATLEQLPEVCRSGMSTEVWILENEKTNATLVPLEAVERRRGKSYVTVPGKGRDARTEVEVRTGLSDEQHIEILDGVKAGDKVLVRSYGDAMKDLKKQPKASPLSPIPSRRPGR